MDITSLPLAPVGATGILAVVIMLILRGALIPRSVHQDRVADKKETIEYYRTALEREIARNHELSLQNQMLMEVGKTANHVLSSLPISPQDTEGGRDEVASSK